MANSPARIMVITAHPQDPFERTGGTVAKHVARGDLASIISLTTGVVTHAFNIFPATGEDKLRDIEKVKEAKRQEFERAAKVLGATEWHCLDFPESPLIVGINEYITLVNLIRGFRPDVVLCAHPVEVGRQDHMDSGRVAVAAVDYARADGFPSPLAPHTVPDIFMYYYDDFRSQQLMGTTRHDPDVIVDTTAGFEKKCEAMCVFAGTQAKAGEDYPKRVRDSRALVDGYAARMTGSGAGYAERYVRWNAAKVPYLPLS